MGQKTARLPMDRATRTNVPMPPRRSATDAHIFQDHAKRGRYRPAAHCRRRGAMGTVSKLMKPGRHAARAGGRAPNRGPMPIVDVHVARTPGRCGSGGHASPVFPSEAGLGYTRVGSARTIGLCRADPLRRSNGSSMITSKNRFFCRSYCPFFLHGDNLSNFVANRRLPHRVVHTLTPQHVVPPKNSATTSWAKT